MDGKNVFVRRHRPTPALVFGLVVSAGLLVALSLEVRGHPLSPLERDVFRLIDRTPTALRPALNAILQLGAYGATFVAAFVALLAHRRRLALELLIAGNLGYWLAIAVNVLVVRQRPGEPLTNIPIRGPIDYPSGHVSVAAALGFTVARLATKRQRRLIWVAVAVVAIARGYVGAHPPIDVLGGLLVGWLAACLTRLVLGQYNPGRSLTRARAVLGAKGIELTEIGLMTGGARGSIRLRARTSDGRELFIKVTSNGQRDADRLYRLYRRVLYRSIEDEPPFATARQKNEHEAYLSLLVERAGTRTPRLLTTATDGEGGALLVQEFVAGRALDEYAAPDLDERGLADIWQQVALLHAAGIAHRDLRPANILLRDSTAFLLDFGVAEENARPDQLARDLVEVLVATARLAGAEKAVGVASAAVGCDALAASLPYLQKAALSHATRATIGKRSQPLAEIRGQIERQCATAPAKPARLSRLSRRSLLTLIMLGLAVYFLLPRASEVHAALRGLTHANPVWVLCGALASAATYLVSAFILRAAVPRDLPMRPTVLVQLGSAFTNRLGPGSVGGVALAIMYLRKQGWSTVEAATAVAIVRVSGTVSAFALLPFLLLDTRNTRLHLLPAPRGLTILLAAIGVLLCVAAVLAIPRLRRGSRSIGRQVVGSVRSLLTSKRGLRLIVLSLALTLAYGICLYFALLAVGITPNVAHVLLVSIVGEGVASAAPTPGGLGATEAALVSGLVILAVPTGPAIAGVLIYRLLTFWLPMLPGYVALQRLRRAGYV